MIELRPYQNDVVGRVYSAILRGVRKLLTVAGTGTGKTVIAAAAIGDLQHPTLFLVHRKELATQSYMFFRGSLTVPVGLIAEEMHRDPANRNGYVVGAAMGAGAGVGAVLLRYD